MSTKRQEIVDKIKELQNELKNFRRTIFGK